MYLKTDLALYPIIKPILLTIIIFIIFIIFIFIIIFIIIIFIIIIIIIMAMQLDNFVSDIRVEDILEVQAVDTGDSIIV